MRRITACLFVICTLGAAAACSFDTSGTGGSPGGTGDTVDAAPGNAATSDAGVPAPDACMGRKDKGPGGCGG